MPLDSNAIQDALRAIPDIGAAFEEHAIVHDGSSYKKNRESQYGSFQPVAGVRIEHGVIIARCDDFTCSLMIVCDQCGSCIWTWRGKRSPVQDLYDAVRALQH